MRTTKYTNRLMFVLPVAKAPSADSLLSRHGYGSDMFCVEAVDKVENKTVTHKVCAVVADNAMLTILRNICTAVDRDFKEKPRPVDPALDEENLKRKPSTDK